MNFQQTLKIILITVIICSELFTGLLFARSFPAPVDEMKEDTTIYTIDKTDLLSIRFYPLFKRNSLDIMVPGEKLTMKPHGTMNFGVGFNYKSLGLGISIGFPSFEESNQIFGRTSKFDLQASYYGNKLAADGFFQRYKGYYVDNPSALVAWDEPYYPQNEDLRVLSIGGTAFYIFNSDKFSYKAAYLRNVIQKKSAGSFTVGVFAFLDEVLSDKGFIPETLPDSIQGKLNVK